MNPTATTIVVAREDFSIPGGEESTEAGREPVALENRFFNLLRDSKPDVVVLDLSRANGDGVGMILKIRRQSSVPILVVFGEESTNVQDYRIVATWQPKRWLGVGLGYNRFAVDVNVGTKRFDGSLNWKYQGPMLFYNAVF